MESLVRDLWGWGRSSPCGEALLRLGMGVTHSGGMTNMLGAGCRRGPLVGFPMGACNTSSSRQLRSGSPSRDPALLPL